MTLDAFRFGKPIRYGRATVVAKTPLTLQVVYRRVYQNYLSHEGFLGSVKTGIAEFEKAGFVVECRYDSPIAKEEGQS